MNKVQTHKDRIITKKISTLQKNSTETHQSCLRTTFLSFRIIIKFNRTTKLASKWLIRLMIATFQLLTKKIAGPRLRYQGLNLLRTLKAFCSLTMLICIQGRGKMQNSFCHLHLRLCTSKLHLSYSWLLMISFISLLLKVAFS